MFKWFNELVSADMMAKKYERVDTRAHARAAGTHGKR